MIQSYDSIIFDLDGTLWDPSETCVNSWNEVLATLEFVREPITKEALQRVFGMKVDLIPDVLFKDLTKEQKDEIMTKCIQHENVYIKKHGAVLYEDLRFILGELKKTHRLFIVSNCQAGYIESFLDYYGLESYFEDIECPGNTGLDKSENIKLIMERNHLISPIYVGDTVGDYEAAKANDLPFFFASYGFGSVEEPDEILSSLKDLVSH